MSVGRRIIDGAKSGLNSLLDRVAADDTPLSGIEREELDAELSRRVEARKAAPAAPEQNPRARWAGAGEEAARRRREAADAREKRIRGARAEKKKAEDAAREAAWRKLQEDARRAAAAGGTRPPPSSSSSSSSSAGSGGPRMPLRKDDKIAKYYKVLDLPYGADFEQVKAAYRKLIRKYHPDLHGSTPQKQKAANELTVQVTQAYNELEAHLKKQST
ncbi:MAG TPA: J domain-containing protein [Kofleriaceae bacterium]|nr:J domain-containing protein [Kofleriaceae bacterium]